MLSTADLERLIAAKRREIQEEKIVLGLSAPGVNDASTKESESKTDRRVRFNRPRALSENNVPATDIDTHSETAEDLKEDIPPDLERYIRRYVGLPVMLKAGEYSPNNPLIRGERTSGDALLGLGEYERRRNTLRKMRQRQYKEYLDQQAKIKQEAKEKAERERKEREEKERLREERERERLESEREISPERRRASVSRSYVAGANNTYITKVDTGVQVDHRSTPLSVAVQTDDDHMFRLSPQLGHKLLTQAERELSPRTVDKDMAHSWEWTVWDKHERRRSHGDERPAARRAYRPSLFDAEAIQMRNERAEKEAVERRQCYQQELKNQIMEQQRIREERKTREKMLEQAEMRKLEEQLRSLKTAQEREIERQHDISSAMKDNAADYDKKREKLQREIDLEHEALLKAAIHPKRTHTSRSESPQRTNLPFYYKPEKLDRPPYSTNIPDNSIFSSNYDVESYLRRNLNPNKETLSNKIDLDTNRVTEKAIVHETPKDLRKSRESFDKDSLPIPVLRHSPKRQMSEDVPSSLSEKMQMVDDKWRVPAVQTNILQSLPNEKGKNISILTQLGSIRRQLQLEQLKLDKMMSKSNN